jgi:uncharacterized damage-inducible protein DinB
MICVGLGTWGLGFPSDFWLRISDLSRYHSSMIPFSPDLFADHFRFIRWGDEQCLAAAGGLSAEEYFKDRGFSAGTVHKLLVHMMSSQWTWLTRFRGGSLKRPDDDREFPVLASLRQRWPTVHTEWEAFLKTQTVDSLATPFTHNDFSGKSHTLPLGRLVQHVMDHCTYHRGQFNSMLKMAGGKPLNLSLYPFYEREGTTPVSGVPA